MVAAPALDAQSATETEPNDVAADANVVQLGDTINGLIDRLNDLDYFAFDLEAGAKLVLSFTGPCPGLVLYDRDATTALASRHCYTEHADSLYATTTAAGRYYVSVRQDDDLPGDSEYPPTPYKLRLFLYTAPPHGPSNPLTRLTADVGEVTAMAAAPNGDMIVGDYTLDPNGFMQERLKRVTPDGDVSVLASDVKFTGQIAIDAFGDLLVPSGDEGGVVWRYNLMTGARTVFTGPSSGPFPYTGVTIGADGDVWLSMPGTTSDGGAKLSRFDALGNYKSQVAVGVRTFFLTTAQTGEIYFMAQDSGDVYRLADNTAPVRVITAPSVARGYGNRGIGIGGVALDRDGWVYLIQPRQAKLLLFNAQYQLARDPLAQLLDSLGWKKDQHLLEASPAWMRDKNGRMTSRLLVGRGSGSENVDPGRREILELNSRGMRAPGADPGLKLKKKSLRNGAVNVAYADTLELGGGSATWTVVSGALPAGITLANSGVLTGTPTSKGTFDFAVRAADGPRAGFGRFSITVGESPQVSVNDITTALMGGASLPAATVQYLDNLGNKNGRLDVGDLRAYLRSQGQLSGGRQP